jgi:acetylornithine/N-succinyldiaminopimelate aminotransferase
MTLMNTLTPQAPAIVGAKGPSLLLRNKDGSVSPYLDWWSNSGCMSLRRESKPLAAALAAVTAPDAPWLVPQIHPFLPREELAQRWCSALEMDRVFFSVDGSGTVEAMIKLLRLHAARHGTHGSIWTCYDSFHGRTYGSVSAGDGPDYHYDGMRPHLQGFKHFHRPSDIDTTDAIGIIITPIRCYKDSALYDDEWWQEMSMVLASGVPLAVDDVQTGAGRCGELSMSRWMERQYNVFPDLVSMGKGFAMGTPLTSVFSRGDFDFEPGQHFCTFGGACALPIYAALGMFGWLEKNISEVRLRSARFQELLRRQKWATNVRGIGMMASFEPADGVPSAALVSAAQRHGLIVTAFGAPVKLFPHLDADEEELAVGMHILGNAHRDVAQRLYGG